MFKGKDLVIIISGLTSKVSCIKKGLTTVGTSLLQYATRALDTDMKQEFRALDSKQCSTVVGEAYDVSNLLQEAGSRPKHRKEMPKQTNNPLSQRDGGQSSNSMMHPHFQGRKPEMDIWVGVELLSVVGVGVGDGASESWPEY